MNYELEYYITNKAFKSVPKIIIIKHDFHEYEVMSSCKDIHSYIKSSLILLKKVRVHSIIFIKNA